MNGPFGHHLATVTVAAALSTASPAVLASPFEIPIDVTGSTGAVELVFGAHTVGAGLATAVDQDLYTFDAVAGDRLRLALTTLTVNLDAQVRLRDPVGTLLRTVSCSGSTLSGCSLSFDETLAVGGRYSLNVSDLGTDNAGNYVLHLERYPPVDNWLGVAYATPHDDEIGHFPDLDFFAFSGAAGTVVSLSLQTLGVNLDPRLEVWDPSGVLVVDTGCESSSLSGCSVTVDLGITADGVYRVATFDQGWDNLGLYRLQINCAFGSCPTLPVPEPASWALWLAGLAALGRIAMSRPRRAIGCS